MPFREHLVWSDEKKFKLDVPDESVLYWHNLRIDGSTLDWSNGFLNFYKTGAVL